MHLATSKVVVQLSSYLQSIEAEKQKIKSQVKRLCQENAWLRDELAAAQKKLQESEQHAAQIEVELSHLKFLKELKRFDEDLNAPAQPQQPPSIQQSQPQQHSTPQPNNDESLSSINDSKAYGEDEEDQSQNNCNLFFYGFSEKCRKKLRNCYLKHNNELFIFELP